MIANTPSVEVDEADVSTSSDLDEKGRQLEGEISGRIPQLLILDTWSRSIHGLLLDSAFL